MQIWPRFHLAPDYGVDCNTETGLRVTEMKILRFSSANNAIIVNSCRIMYITIRPTMCHVCVYFQRP